MLSRAKLTIKLNLDEATYEHQIIGENLEQYDNEHYPPIGDHINDIDMVIYLMKSRNLH
jgi:hypothetical protein